MGLPKDPWVGIKAMNLAGEMVEVSQFWENKRVVLFLVRRFG